MTDHIDGALGEESQFHSTHGFYVHGLSIEAATLPEGWLGRTIAVSHPVGTRGHTGLCIEAHDLAASKLFAHREKDRVFVVTLLSDGLIDGPTLLERIGLLPVADDIRDRLIRWVEITLTEIREED
ncbi:MAG: hypothetical protein KKA32_05115 [Actinobacteria bacterium]|nr:hypothetical protein [Actinomycetota bacterium]